MKPPVTAIRSARPPARPGALRALAVCLALGLAGGLTPRSGEPPAREPTPPATETAPAYDPTTAYAERDLASWRVRVNQKLLAEPDLCARTLRELECQLEQIARRVPPAALVRLREIPIWVERASTRFACMCYHESRAWLSAHGVNPDKTGAVELANPEAFLDWTREQPWMVLHELAHGYHQRVLGEDHPGLRRCFEQARAGGRYEAVLHVSGRTERHYALTNLKEYFAEGTEAFFGTNDFYPFVRAELRRHDPDLEALLAEIWEGGTPAATPQRQPSPLP